MNTMLNIVTVENGRVRFDQLEIMRNCADKLKSSQWLLNIAKSIKTNKVAVVDCGSVKLISGSQS